MNRPTIGPLAPQPPMMDLEALKRLPQRSRFAGRKLDECTCSANPYPHTHLDID